MDPPRVTILTSFFDFNANPWMAANARYCLGTWRAAGAYVVLVELACSSTDTDYVFAPKDGVTQRSSAEQDEVVPAKSSVSDVLPGDAAPTDELIADVVVGIRVRDVMWYKEMALNVGLAYVPSGCPLVGWFDHDVAFVPSHGAGPDWWVSTLVHTFQQHPRIHFVQPFAEVALTTERIRNAVLGEGSDKGSDEGSDEGSGALDHAVDHTVGAAECGTPSDERGALCSDFPPTVPGACTALQTDDCDSGPVEATACTALQTDDCDSEPVEPTDASDATPRLSLVEAVTRCRGLARVRGGVMANGGRRTTTGVLAGVTGCAWVGRRATVTKMRFMGHVVAGGGSDVQLNLWLGATNRRSLVVTHEQQRWYFGEGREPEHAGLRRVLGRYRKRLHATVPPPAKCAHLPCTLVHLYHGELATKRTALERHYHLLHRGFQITTHLRSHLVYPDILEWTDAFRDTGVHADLRASFERSQSVREQVLRKLAKMQRCLTEVHQNVHGMLQLESGAAVHDRTTHHELHGAMRACLKAFDRVRT
jgi:hypothetical protein